MKRQLTVLRISAVLLGTLMTIWTSNLRADTRDVRVSVVPKWDEFYLGDHLDVTVNVVNQGASVIKILGLPKALWTMDLSFTLTREGKDRQFPTMKLPAPTKPLDSEYISISGNESISFDVDITSQLGLAAAGPGSYIVKASLRVGNRIVDSEPASIVVKSVPDLRELQKVTLAVPSQGGGYERYLEVGVAHEKGDKSILLAILRQVSEHQGRVFRLGEVSSSTRIEVEITNADCVHIRASGGDQDPKDFVLDVTEERLFGNTDVCKR